jgi:DNA polymerase delta subunit 2
MLEDDSGRIQLVGDILKSFFLVTGCIIAVMGTENVNGEFEVIDLKFADLAPQPKRWALLKPPPPSSSNGSKSSSSTKKKIIKDEDEDKDVEMTNTPSSSSPRQGGTNKIAIVSGLEFSGTDTSYAMELNLLLEYLLGDTLDPTAQQELSHISRLIIAGNSIAADRKPVGDDTSDNKKSHKKYGYDSSSYDPIPSQLLDDFMSELLPTIPITLLPGTLDPANASYPQQPIHAAMFPKAREFAAIPGSTDPGWLDAVTNPWEGEVEGWRVLGTGGQNLDDIFKYVDSDDRLGMMEAMCRWRCSAPTAPDTLCKFFCQFSLFPHLYAYVG